MSKPLFRDRSDVERINTLPEKWPWRATLWLLFFIFIIGTGIELLISSEEINFDNGFVKVVGNFLKYFVGPLVYIWFLDLFILPLYRKSRAGKQKDAESDPD